MKTFVVELTDGRKIEVNARSFRHSGRHVKFYSHYLEWGKIAQIWDTKENDILAIYEKDVVRRIEQ